MEITRETVNEWLEENRRNREWLASACKTSLSNVGMWLNKKGEPREIPSEHKITIGKLMEEDAAKLQAKPPHNIVLEFSDADYEPVEKAALGKGMTIREWAKRVLNEAATMSDAEFFETFAPKTAIPFPAQAHLVAAAGSPLNGEVMDWDGNDDTVMVKINGLSMTPLLDDGDVIPMKHKRVSRNPFMKKGLVYLVEYDGGYTVKEYNTRPATEDEKGEEWVENGKVKILKSLNPEFPEIIIKQPLEWIAWLPKV